MSNKYDWLIKRTPRSVDAMKLWAENPRLNPEEDYSTMTDFADELTIEDSDRKSFIALAKSITEKGFIPADPVVLWQDEENGKYYVAEGNRRVLALKLLRKPQSAPKSIRATFVKLATSVDSDSLAKIPVSISPSFEDAEWYISQRNSMSTLQKRWEAEQQRRWVMELYIKYEGNLDIIRSKIDLAESVLKTHIRILKLKALVNEAKSQFTNEEFDKATSIRFPITTFQRFFSSMVVKEKWGIELEEYDFVITSNRISFLNAFVEAIKRMILPKGASGKIDSRSIDTVDYIAAILETLPVVEFGTDEEEDSDTGNDTGSSEGSDDDNEEPTPEPEPDPPPPPKDDPDRNKLVDVSYNIASDMFRLVNIFDELKRIPFSYKNSIGASIRIFLDLAVLNYIKSENIEKEIEIKNKCSLRDVTLKKRLEYIKQRKINQKAKSVLGKFLNPDNMFSLDVLNGYHHNSDHHFIDKKHLNQFWDFLMPLFKILVDIKEDE